MIASLLLLLAAPLPSLPTHLETRHLSGQSFVMWVGERYPWPCEAVFRADGVFTVDDMVLYRPMKAKWSVSKGVLSLSDFVDLRDGQKFGGVHTCELKPDPKWWYVDGRWKGKCDFTNSKGEVAVGKYMLRFRQPKKGSEK